MSERKTGTVKCPTLDSTVRSATSVYTSSIEVSTNVRLGVTLYVGFFFKIKIRLYILIIGLEQQGIRAVSVSISCRNIMSKS